jgi:D-glycero-D-manno-heptose 1,7-bisphosphate phosphatase
MVRQRAVFLDRDGVINEMWWDSEHGTVDSPMNPDQFSLLPGVGEAIRMLRDLGFLIVVVSNQPGVAKGKMVPGLLDEITRKMHQGLSASRACIDAVYYCLHHPEAVFSEYHVDCDCRKPKPGLLLRAANHLNIDLPRSYMIGDGTVDVLAGKAAACKTIWLGCLKCDHCRILEQQRSWPDFIASDLLNAAKIVNRVSR